LCIPPNRRGLCKQTLMWAEWPDLPEKHREYCLWPLSTECIVDLVESSNWYDDWMVYLGSFHT
jgi:hypothetical protein